MTTVLDELSAEGTTLDRAAIVRRVQDWSLRIHALHARIETWLPDGFRTRVDRFVRMDEELMRAFGVEAVDLPILEISNRDVPRAKLVPRGLWIVGTNGRLDLFAADRHWIIVDRAENFARPEWRIAPAERRSDLAPLDAVMLRAAIAV
jgi:hypothetical protein